jgi:uncharacterized protein YukJ
MPIRNYGVVKGIALAGRAERVDNTPHYQVHVRAAGVDYRIAVNVASTQRPPELLFLTDENFAHPVTSGLGALDDGFHPIESKPGGLALDFIRANLFDRTSMQVLPADLPQEDNDLNDKLEHFVGRAIANPEIKIYAFGERWGPEEDKPDKVFGFRPGNGVHDIHMNQGSSGAFADQNGVWQDGALLIHIAGENRWVAVFAAFQSQSWHTDDATGHPIGLVTGPTHEDTPVLILGALVNAAGPAPEAESVTLLNASPAPVDLGGWALADIQKKAQGLTGAIGPGETVKVALAPPVALGNRGGIITLLNAQGLKVHGVSYTAEEGRREGWTVVF